MERSPSSEVQLASSSGIGRQGHTSDMRCVAYILLTGIVGVLPPGLLPCRIANETSVESKAQCRFEL